jgi:hypothetical protein
MRGAFSTVVPVRAGSETDLLSHLVHVGQDIKAAQDLPLTRLETVHFARWVVIPPEKDSPGQGGPTLLVFETNYDGREDDHFDELLQKLLPGLKTIYGYCEGYLPNLDPNGRALIALWKAHQLRPLAFYRAYPMLSVREIRRQADLREGVERRLDQLGAARASGGAVTLNKIGGVPIAPRPGAPEIQAPDKPSSLPPAQWVSWLLLIAVGAALVFLIGALVLGLIAMATIPWPDFVAHRLAREAFRWPRWLAFFPGAGLVTLLFFVLAIRLKEISEPRPEPTASDTDSLLRHREDFQVQNQLTHLVRLKPGPIRKALALAALSSIHLLARILFIRGALGSITSIHFARWVLLPDGRLLFTSNYDGGWEAYLGNFVQLASVGLTAAWSNTRNFPPAKFLIFEGASHERAFKLWARSLQIETAVWYTAHPHLSVQNILQNRELEHAWWGGRVTPLAASLVDQI